MGATLPLIGRASRGSLAILIGAIASIAVAWAIANRSVPRGEVHPLGPYLHTVTDYAYRDLQDFTTLLVTRHKNRTGFDVRVMHFGAPTRPEYRVKFPTARLREWRELVPAWSIARREPHHTEFDPGTFAIIEEASGWPFPGLYARRELSSTAGQPIPTERHVWGLVMPRAAPEGAFSTTGSPPVLLPFRPLWLGFVGNTLIYAVLYLLASLAIRRLVIATVKRARVLWDRVKARKQGRCVRRGCGYPVTGLPVCPECGTTQGKPQPPPDAA